MSKNIYLYIVSSILSSFLAGAADLPYKEGELFVRFAPKINGIQRSTAERNQFLSLHNTGSIKKSYKLVPGLTLIKLPENEKVADALSKLRGKNEILYVEPNYKVKLFSTFPNETESPGRFDEQWPLYNPLYRYDIHAPEAWDIVTDSDTIVAVLDTGIDYSHSDVVPNIWINEAEHNGIADFDDDNNGYIDDIYGWDFADNDRYPTDYQGHGTHCAGIIGAVGNNGEGITGICWNVKLMNLKIFPNYNEETFTNNVIDAIEYASSKGVKILSNSWGGPEFHQSLSNTIQAANGNGILFIAAAGNYQIPVLWFDNDATPVYPANYNCDNIISVLATNSSDNIWNLSHYGHNTVDLGAPGESILSCKPGNTYQYMSGTSMAAPHVAGACALVWAANTKLNHLEVKQAILGSVDVLGSLDNKCATEGRLNVYNAVSLWPLRLTISDNIGDGNSVQPNDIINYTIHYDTYTVSDTGVELTETLPDEADYLYSDPNGSYNPATHTVTWYIGNMAASTSGTYKIWAKVNGQAIPGYRIINKCKLEGDTFGRKASKKTAVDCYRNYAVFVDADANEGGNGLWWDTAYFTV